MAAPTGKKTKKIKALVKLNLPAGKATPAPPVGPSLGQHGVPLMDFCKEFNARTAKLGDSIIPIVLTVYEDRSFTFITKTQPASYLLKDNLKINSGSHKPGNEVAGTVSKKIIDEIVKRKVPELTSSI